ncbi:hypothetical protein ACA910_020071 [Epithemia clementina (nom. ined.)]
MMAAVNDSQHHHRQGNSESCSSKPSQNSIVSYDLQDKLQTVSNELDQQLTPSRYDVQAALEFLEMQKARVEKAEAALMEVTREILPLQRLSPSNLTTTEVAQVLRELQTIYERQQHRLLEKVRRLQQQQEETEADIRSTDPHEPQQPQTLFVNRDGGPHQQSTPPTLTDHTPSPWVEDMPASSQGRVNHGNTVTWRPSTPSVHSKTLHRPTLRPLTPYVIGRVLSDVVETDQETDEDGITTSATKIPTPKDRSIVSCPSSYLKNQSQTSSQGAAASNSPSTPCFSASAVAGLQRQEQNHNPPSTGRKRLDAFAQLELTLQRDIHKILLPNGGDEGDDDRQSLIRPKDLTGGTDQVDHHNQGADDESSFNNEKYRESNGSLNVSGSQEQSSLFGDHSSMSPNKALPEEGAVETYSPTSMIRHVVAILDDSADDDSALYCATVLADRDWAPRSKRLQLPSHRPSHVQFVEGDGNSDANQTMLTIDEDSILDLPDKEEAKEKSLLSKNPPPSLLDPIDETDSVVSGASAETPVLDRYRLVIDDTSPHGILVIPNERRKHRSAKKNHNQPKRDHDNQGRFYSNHHHNNTHDGNGTTTQGGITQTVPSNSTTSPISVRTKYRKTPHPNKSNRFKMAPTIDENTPLNVFDDDITPTANNCTTANSTMWATPHAANSSAPNRSPLQSILLSSAGSKNQSISFLTSPAARPIALRPVQSHNPENRRHTSLQDSKLSPTPLSANKATIASVSTIFSSPMSHSTLNATSTILLNRSKPSLPPQIKNISAKEYDEAPRIVKMQISLSAVQDAVHSINQALCLSPIVGEDDQGNAIPVDLSEGDLRDILAPLSHRQCKNVAMSLCHWRRLLLKRQRLSSSVHDSSQGNEEITFTIISHHQE